MIIVPVDLPDRSYRVVVGDGAVSELGSLIPAKAKRAAVITQASIAVPVETGIEQKTFLIGDGEQYKTLATVEELCRGFAAWGMTRNDVVVAVGGGLVTDVAGFAAAVYHRGIAVIHVPTTLLGQVDAGNRRQNRRESPRGQEPRRRLLAAQRRDLRHGHLGDTSRSASSAAALARSRNTTSWAGEDSTTTRCPNGWQPACGSRPLSSPATNAKMAGGRFSTMGTHLPTCRDRR